MCLSASFLQHLFLSPHSNSNLYFLLQLLYLKTSNLLLCQTSSISKLCLKAVANTVLGRNFPSGISTCLSEKNNVLQPSEFIYSFTHYSVGFFHGSSNFLMPPSSAKKKVFWLISDKTNGNRFFSHLNCFGFLSVCWKLEMVLLRDSAF